MCVNVKSHCFRICWLLIVACWLMIATTLSQQTASTFSSLSSWTKNSSYCRTVYMFRPLLCPVDRYRDFTCITCYMYLPIDIVPLDKQFLLTYNEQCEFVMERRIGENDTLKLLNRLDYDYANESSAIFDTIVLERGKELWRQCCEASWRCCDRMLTMPTKSPSDEAKVCPRTWDSWQCFDETDAGTVHESECEDYIYFKSEPPPCRQKLIRPCRENGTWPSFRDPTTEWTNYTSCSNVDHLRMRHKVHIGAYAVSLMALAPAIAIFFFYKQLRVHRITMHKNLFFSIFVNGLVFITFKDLIIMRHLERQDREPGEEPVMRISGDACRLLFALTKYTRATNYMWMFCEGFYLHKLIVAAFTEQKSLLVYYIMGWVSPIIPVIIYSILRLTDEQANIKCWGLYPVEKYEWVVNGPNLASLVINFMFLFNIIRVLVTKLRATHTNEPNQYRKAVRATLVLVPLFGLHFVVTIYRPSTGPCWWLESYFYINYLLDGLQGFLVALIFCYLNGEILSLLRRSLTQYKLQRRLDRSSRRMRDTYKQSTTTSNNVTT